MSIKLLDPRVVARIAAGEVVERPASVIKELVENSLDAGASQITVEVGGGGISLIQVTDNGVGIPANEVELAFERYATSKIESLEDLERISSLGFRGEALPSIAAVAEVDVVTCAAGEASGTHLRLVDGGVAERAAAGRSQGTTISVRSLFRRVPARLKFLKSVATENSHIANVVTQYALAYPEVKFNLITDGKRPLQTTGSGRLLDSVIAVYGLDTARNMLEVKTKDGWQDSPEAVRATGYVSAPSISRTGRGYLSFFVNRRWINSRLLTRAVEDAYHGLLMQDRHPVAVMNISLPPQQVDVNIHPTKSEVKFSDDHLVFAAVQRAVRRTLVEQTPVPQIEEPTPVFTATPQPKPALWSPVELDEQAPASAPTPILTLPILRVLGQMASSYIVAESSDGLYLIDQHAAHERILFEKVRARQQIEEQGLLEPVAFEVDPKRDAILKSNYRGLAEFGFILEPFGERTYLVRAVPALLHDKDWAVALRELLDSVSSGAGLIESAAMSIACHSAVRAGQSLSDDEMRALIRELEKAALPNTCPHGRPTMIHLSQQQLEKEFGRR